MKRQPGVFSRRTVLTGPLLVLAGKLSGVELARSQHREREGSLTSSDFGGFRLQAEIDHFDHSFLPPCDLMFALVADTHINKQRQSAVPTAETFAVELHGARGRTDLNDPRTEKIFSQLNAQRPDLVLHLGDMVHGFPGDRRWKITVTKTNAMLERLEVPYYLVAGNHDIGNKLSVPVPNGWQQNAGDPDRVFHISEENIEIYRKAFGAAFYAVEHGDHLFLILNASAFNSGLEHELQQWQWLEHQLANSTSFENVFLATHSLPYWSRVDEVGERNYEVIDEPARSRLLGLCATYGVRAVFCGHIHHDHARYHGSTLISATPSASFSRDNWGLYFPLREPTWAPSRAGYCLIRVTGKRLVRQLVRTVDLLPVATPCQLHNSFKPRRLMALQTADGLPGPIALTVPPIDDHPGLSAPGNATRSRRFEHVEKRDEVRSSWVSGHSEREVEWLQVSWKVPQRIARVIVHPGFKKSSGYRIQLRDGEEWTTHAEGKVGASPGNSRPPAIEHHFPETTASAIRILFSRAKSSVSLRRFEVFNSEGINVAEQSNLSTTSASSSSRNVPVVNTAAFIQAFDLNPSYLRLDPRATAFSSISPVSDFFRVDPLVLESVRHAEREGARVWAVLSAEEDTVRRSSEEEIDHYCRYLAGVLPAVDVWEVSARSSQLEAMTAAIRKAAPKAKIAVPRGSGVSSRFVVDRDEELQGSSQRHTLKIHSPFESLRGRLHAGELARWLVSCLASDRIVPSVSLLPDEGLLDGWDDPMTAFYVVRVFNTVFAGSQPSRRHCDPHDDLVTNHFKGPHGRLITAERSPGAAKRPVTVRLRRAAKRAWSIDPLTSVSCELVVRDRDIPELLVPSYPMILRLS